MAYDANLQFKHDWSSLPVQVVPLQHGHGNLVHLQFKVTQDTTAVHCLLINLRATGAQLPPTTESVQYYSHVASTVVQNPV